MDITLGHIIAAFATLATTLGVLATPFLFIINRLSHRTDESIRERFISQDKLFDQGLNALKEKIEQSFDLHISALTDTLANYGKKIQDIQVLMQSLQETISKIQRDLDMVHNRLESDYMTRKEIEGFINRVTDEIEEIDRKIDKEVDKIDKRTDQNSKEILDLIKRRKDEGWN